MKSLEAIRSLKQKLQEMQKELQKVSVRNNKQNKDRFAQTQVVNSKWNSSKVPTPTSPSWKNPTFWGTNPILAAQNQSPVKKWQKKQKKSRKFELSPKALDLSNNLNNNYYDHEPPQPQLQKKFETSKYFSSKRYEHSFHGWQRDTPRFEKKKTYVKDEKNPILNPPLSKSEGKKKCTRPGLLSPKIMFTQNPKSDPLVYFFKDKKVSLSPKNRSNRKNASPSMGQILSSSLQQKPKSPSKKSCRKHYEKYFKETYESNWA